ncbi:hypothetical protein Tco_1141826 [Tanacetum coccineum]
MVISDEEEVLVSEDPSKQGRMEEAEDTDVEKEYAGVDYDFDLTEQQVTPLKALQVEVQSQEMFEAELSVLSAAKILQENQDRVKTLIEEDEAKSFKHIGKSKEVGTLRYLSLVVPLIKVGDEAVHKELGDRMERAATTASSFKAEQDSERKEADDIDWSKIVEQAQERQSGSMIRYQALKKKPVTIAQASGSEPFDQEKSTEEPKELSEEDLKKMLEIVPVEEFRVEALQNNLVKEKFRSVEPTEDMERALWVELKRLYEPDKEDTLWKLQRYMHDPLTWRLYGSCAVHHVFSTRGHCIYMLPEKDYPLTTEVMMLMLSRRLQVEEDSEMARDLVKKIFIKANRSRR